MESWLLENVEEDFKVNVTMKDKKKENPQKYKDQLKRLNDVYIMGNIPEDEYKNKAKILQMKIADLTKDKPKQHTFSADWKEVYQMLDDKHKKAFWQNLIKAIYIDEDLNVKGVLY